ncbi:MAG: RHS repeat-associated core domain-containing protein, partial [Bacteroidia bacterium]|nr:RHS repeat-associated core domain-containing protein [Bacteroidia bacterium]
SFLLTLSPQAFCRRERDNTNTVKLDIKKTYNGNISATRWKAGTETAERGYKFPYDGLNRLTAAHYGEGTSLAANLNRYNELVAYDKTDNIKTLRRQGKHDAGFGLIDNLAYAYTGNKLTKVTDATAPSITHYGTFHFVNGANIPVEYTYDANGNLKKDYNKKIVDIQYNSLNLPNGLQFTNGNTTNYVYNAAGQKLSVTYQTAKAGVTIPMTNVMTPLAPANVFATTKTDYCGNVIYENGAVSKILTKEGYITLSGTTPIYHYYLKDHQGNNRVVINQAGTVEQVNHYYPFGGLFGEGLQDEKQPYKYNGKELDRMHGLNLFDYGARHYDAALGRWMTVDPLAEKNYHISQYAYSSNNPVNRIDPDGRLDDWIYNKETKEYIWDGRITNRSETPNGYKYIGPSLKNVDYHYKNTNPIRAIFKNAKFGEDRTPWAGEITNAIDDLTSVEMWLESPSKNVGIGVLKIATNVAYSIINSPYSMLTGKTIGGSPLNSTERMDAFIDVVPGLLSGGATKTGTVIKTSKNSFIGFNQFIKKVPDITSSKGLPAGMKWQTRAGQQFQKNKINQQSLRDYDMGLDATGIISNTNNELKKKN